MTKQWIGDKMYVVEDEVRKYIERLEEEKMKYWKALGQIRDIERGCKERGIGYARAVHELAEAALNPAKEKQDE